MGTIITGDAGTTPVIAGATINVDGGNQVTLNGTPKDVKLSATLQDGTPASGQWTTDDTRIGSVGTDGVFHANGYVGGTVTISLLVGKGQVKTTLTADVDIVDNTRRCLPRLTKRRCKRADLWTRRSSSYTRMTARSSRAGSLRQACSSAMA